MCEFCVVNTNNLKLKSIKRKRFECRHEKPDQEYYVFRLKYLDNNNLEHVLIIISCNICCIGPKQLKE